MLVLWNRLMTLRYKMLVAVHLAVTASCMLWVVPDFGAKLGVQIGPFSRFILQDILRGR